MMKILGTGTLCGNICPLYAKGRHRFNTMCELCIDFNFVQPVPYCELIK